MRSFSFYAAGFAAFVISNTVIESAEVLVLFQAAALGAGVIPICLCVDFARMVVRTEVACRGHLATALGL